MPEKKPLRIVADTNVLVSALLGKVLRVFLQRLQENKFELVFSEKTFKELAIVLNRPKFEKYISPVDIIVTGDSDLLVLDPFRYIPIITPEEFLLKII